MMRRQIATVLVTGPLIAATGQIVQAHARTVEFRGVLDNAPLEVKPKSNEVETDAVKEFKATGRNPYRGQEPALAEGKGLYLAHCQACHLPDGTGRIGPSLVGDEHTYPRVATDVGMFEVIYGGASGVMPSWSQRGMTQDEMLKIIAYVRSLKRP